MFKIPFHKYRLSIEEEKAVLRVLRSGWLTSGKEVASLEDEFSKFIGEGVMSVAVSSCTSALFLTLKALNLPKNTEILLPSLTYVSDVLSILHLGHIPVLVDIDLEDYCISHEDLARKVTNKSGAVVVVHYSGNPCKMDAITEICYKHNLLLIEDCAHAIEAQINGKNVGTFGNAAVYSFYPNKNITTAEGGIIVSKNNELIEKCKRLRNHGIDIDASEQHDKSMLRNFDIHEPGFKLNMNDIQAALGRVQLKSIHSMYSKRRELFNFYSELLDGLNVRIISKINNVGVKCAHHLLPIEVDENKRNILITALMSNGVQPSIHFKPVHKFSFARNHSWSKVELPNTEMAYNRQLSLPLYPIMTIDDVKHVCKVVRQTLQ